MDADLHGTAADTETDEGKEGAMNQLNGHSSLGVGDAILLSKPALEKASPAIRTQLRT